MNSASSALPCIKPAVWEFSISHEERPEGVRACGSIFYTDTAKQVHELARRSGLEAHERRVDKGTVERDGVLPVHTYIRIKESEDSKSLHQIIDGLRSLYGIDLAKNSLIANESRYFFRVRKFRAFTKEQIQESPYLLLYADKFQIGTWADRTDEEFSRGALAVANDSKQASKVRCGFVSPFPAIGVDQWLKDNLERCSLIGLQFNPIVVRKISGSARKPLWNLTGSITLPRTQTKYINKHGFEKEPFDDWSDRWESAFFYDEGYDPPVLQYSSKHLDAVGAFDVAITAERVGNGPKTAFPEVIVSQRFRKTLEELKIPGVGYLPIVAT